MNIENRTSIIFRITLLGSVVNLLLVAIKFVAGVMGASAAMMADAVHSLSDLLTDFIVLIFVKISGKPADQDHPYGHGKYETLATGIIGMALLAVGAVLMAEGVEKIIQVAHGQTIASPGKIALWAALASIVLKELIYQLTVRVAHRVKSEALVANAWHHRTDALSSVGTALGIGGAIFLGDKWTILDPIAACIVSVFIILAAAKLMQSAVNQLMEKSLPREIEEQIGKIIAEDGDLQEMHHLRTRQVGNVYSIEMHLRMPGNTSLYQAHQHATLAERRLKETFGPDTIVSIHIEPLKVNGVYQPC